MGRGDTDPAGAGRHAGHPGRRLATVDQPPGDQLADGRGGDVTLVAFAFGVLRWSFGRAGLEKLTEGVNAVINFSNAGIHLGRGQHLVGQTEGFLVIRPYINRMTHSELFSVMTVGMATVAGSVLVGYALLGVPLDYLLAATFRDRGAAQGRSAGPRAAADGR